MAEKEEVKVQEQDFQVKSEIWYGVVRRYEKILPPPLLVRTYVRNRVFFVCNMALLKNFVDWYVTLYPAFKRRAAEVHDELESLYGLNLLVDPEAPEEGYFIDDLGIRIDEDDADCWRVLLQRWDEEEDRRYRNLGERGKRFYKRIVKRIEGLRREIGRQDLTSHTLLLNNIDYGLLVAGFAVVKEKHYVIRPRNIEEGLGIGVVTHSACRKGGIIMARQLPHHNDRQDTGIDDVH